MPPWPPAIAPSWPDPLPPCVEILDLEQGRHAIEIAQGRPMALLSMRGAARLMGAPWWRAVIDLLQTPVAHILDCDDAAGRAAGALRAGQPAIVFDADNLQARAISGLAAACGACVLRERPPSFSLGLPPYRAYRLNALDAFLSTGPGTP